jgi:Fe-Mn family superoxide dismutase
MAPTSRRNFIGITGKAGFALCFGSSLLKACTATSRIRSSKFTTGFEQKPLPYAYNALTEAIDAQTMEIHYSKHAASYASNLRDAAGAEGVDMSKPLEDVLEKVSKYSSKMRNNAGGHYNHELFWNAMSPSGNNLSGTLATAITASFGSFDAFKNQFEEAAKTRFGSGWAWLIVNRDKRLQITSTPNQDNPLMDVAELKGYPLLGLDVWEHAYYLRYQNRRPEYITNWWKVVNWNAVRDRYDSIA